MWPAVNKKQLTLNVVMVICGLSIVLYTALLYMHSYNSYQSSSKPVYYPTIKPTYGPVDKTETFFRHLLSNLDQYNTGVHKLPRQKLKTFNERPSIKKKTPSTLKPESLQFKAITKTMRGDNMAILLHVTDSNSNDVHGCNFEARQLFDKHVALCVVEEHGNGHYGFLCASHGVKCGNITITARFCRYEAYSHSPRILMWQHQVLQQEYCFDHVTKAPSDIPSWQLNPDGQCNKLLLHDAPSHELPVEVACDCIRARFDNVYLIGTSHIRYFSDHLMHSCYSKNFEGKSWIHPSLHYHKLHYLDWGTFTSIKANMYSQLDSFLKPNSSVAIWMQTGSWDFVKIHYEYAMEIGLDLFNQTLSFMTSRIKQSSAKVDFRIIATSPMPYKWHFNNFAIGAFNARMQQISMEHGISYTDAFSIQLPCADDIASVPGNGNHYLARFGNTFGGDVGIAFYYGAFLPQVCPVTGS